MFRVMLPILVLSLPLVACSFGGGVGIASPGGHCYAMHKAGRCE